jgi:hypothetical protein
MTTFIYSGYKLCPDCEASCRIREEYCWKCGYEFPDSDESEYKRIYA